ncbi:hypothetical protein [Roseibium alexandrii]|uniref:Homeodomain-like domain-containing protein n=1 Tax=Roseibium alexandrii (strain DSM 17067 / NCIMB 14079 / DFL-11) TaxID=244592 RepID=A0A5E8GVS8_ROSAD|nr:hypothetical protein [Roseibium alexandrii]EEE44056.2 hypothetical protein SADFL11_1342 [Roseibium alexandrii DFL-11]
MGVTKDGRYSPNWGGISKYDPEFCELAVELGREGKSLSQIAVACGICRKTMENWRREHADFAEALSFAVTCAQAHWEELGRDNIDNKSFSVPMWAKSMSARFKDDYTERRELTGADGGALHTQNVTQIELIAAEPKTNTARGWATSAGAKSIENIPVEVLDAVTDDPVPGLIEGNNEDEQDRRGPVAEAGSVDVELVPASAATFEQHPLHEKQLQRPSGKEAGLKMSDVASKPERITRKQRVRGMP